MLRVILDRLPPHSHYVTAKKEDPDVALEIARAVREEIAAGRPSTWRPRAVDWSLYAELAEQILARLGEIEALLADMPIAGRKRRARPPRRFPRPETAIERAEQQLALEHFESILAEVEEAKERWRALQRDNLPEAT